MHVHTRYSGWRHMKLIHARDCYTEPAALYRRALSAGMDLVAVTDHDTLEGALRLLDSPGVDPARIILGEEVETRFPETGQWVHVGIYDLTEEDHEEVRRLSGNVRDVAAYCRRRNLLHVLNHPFQSFLWQKPVEAYVEDILENFTHVEGLNGGNPVLQNLAVARLCRLSSRFGKRLVQVGGSDAHVLGRTAKAWTEARAADKRDFLSEVAAGRSRVRGRSITTSGLLRDVHRVLWTYYRRLYTQQGEGLSGAALATDLAVATAAIPAVVFLLPAWITLLNQVRQKGVSLAVLKKLSALMARAEGGEILFPSGR